MVRGRPEVHGEGRGRPDVLGEGPGRQEVSGDRPGVVGPHPRPQLHGDVVVLQL